MPLRLLLWCFGKLMDWEKDLELFSSTGVSSMMSWLLKETYSEGEINNEQQKQHTWEKSVGFFEGVMYLFVPDDMEVLNKGWLSLTWLEEKKDVFWESKSALAILKSPSLLLELLSMLNVFSPWVCDFSSSAQENWLENSAPRTVPNCEFESSCERVLILKNLGYWLLLVKEIMKNLKIFFSHGFFQFQKQKVGFIPDVWVKK